MAFELKKTYASLPRVTRGAITMLKGDPKEKNFLYGNGKSVFIRNAEDPCVCDVYTQHAKDVYVAAYAPSGFYIASGDATGKIRIWDTTQKEHILKYEYQPMSGIIKDIVWSPDSKRIIVVGEGREKFGCAFLWDSGSSVGNIDQHTKSINAVDYKSTRPYRAVTASEDFTCNFYEGPPFKYKQSHRNHTNFVNSVRFSPNGEFFVTGGADGKMFLHEGKDGTLIEEIGLGSREGKAHAGGIYGISWSPDSMSVLTASADKSCKIWNMADKTCTTTFKLGSDLEDMQVGCLWMKDYLLSVSLSGAINYLDKENPDTPSKVVMGHYKNITAMAYSSQKSKLYSADFNGRIVAWNSDGSSQRLKGKGHTTEVRFLAVDDDTLFSCAIDDTVRFTNLETEEYGSDVVALGGQPHGFSLGKDGLVVVTLESQAIVIRNKKIVSTLKLSYEASSVSIHPGQTEVAIGCKTDSDVYIYTLDNDTLEEKKRVRIGMGAVLHVGYSPDGAYLGVSMDSRKSVALEVSDNYKDASGQWYGHTGRILGLQWSPDSKYMATCGLDTHVFVYDITQPKKEALAIKFAHPLSVVTGLVWVGNNTIATCAQDCCIKFWSLKA